MDWNFFLSMFKKLIIYSFVKFMATYSKKVRQFTFPPPLFVFVGSEINKNQNPGSEINIVLYCCLIGLDESI